jgi:predicted ATPase
MLTTLRLTNFKAWRDTKEIELKPVTMLLGTNSSGKSSLIQSLLLLKQTAQSSDRAIHLNLGGDEVTDLFNFGDFDNLLTHGTTSPRQFSLTFSF